MLAKLNTCFTRITDHPDLGKLLLRLTFGILILFHGVAKMENGVGWIAKMLEGHGLPGFIAYGAYIGEVIAPVLIILGIFTRPAALVMSINLVVATLLVVGGKFFTINEVGAWGLEGEAMYFFGGLTIMLLGSGRYSVVSNPALR
ncbi:DoxX family membrane protein [Rouxiella sp. S1S-2]|uniref:DoxX family protein n=1 Tax=Rouxiella sp. S1S-2 TaxID=2653856 RepID=UPI0012650C39|nr:DoxX family protein [Rouxiella sp. S1S-2]KAB7897620.1 DoxX family membrane protein [Rouxiella sp. S1S-2]